MLKSAQISSTGSGSSSSLLGASTRAVTAPNASAASSRAATRSFSNSTAARSRPVAPLERERQEPRSVPRGLRLGGGEPVAAQQQPARAELAPQRARNRVLDAGRNVHGASTRDLGTLGSR